MNSHREGWWSFEVSTKNKKLFDEEDQKVIDALEDFGYLK
jgi:hypothetical protein